MSKNGVLDNDCGSKLEQEIEELLPEKIIKKVKNNSFIYIIALVIAVIAISTLAGLAVNANNSIKEQRDIVSGLNLDLTKRGNELTALQTTLSQTEEGKKQIEAAKAQVDDQNKALDTRATSAEQTANKAKSDLAKTQSDLSVKQSDLAKAQRGISKFDQAKSLFDQYDASSGEIAQNIFLAGQALGAQDFATADYYRNLILAEIDTNESIYNQIKAIFDSIKSGNY